MGSFLFSLYKGSENTGKCTMGSFLFSLYKGLENTGK